MELRQQGEQKNKKCQKEKSDMIECEMCKKWFPADEIEACPECGLDLCPSCYDEHVTGCTLQMEKDVDDVIETSIPTICPECGSPLTLDPDPDGSARVYCENCDFCQELDEEQIAELDNGETEEDSDYDEFGNYLGDDAFTCPDCGRTFAPDDYRNGDAGNGFCRVCAPKH